MKVAFTLVLALVSSSVFAAAPARITCEMNEIPVDGDASKVVLTRDAESGFYSVKIDHRQPVMIGGETTHAETGLGSVPSFRCLFSEKVVGLFSCVGVTKDGFRGEEILTSKMVMNEVEGEVYEVEMNTKLLTYNHTFALDACKTN